MVRRLCVYCGSSVGGDPVYAAAADAVGRELVRRGIELVYGGGNIGLMGVLADAVLEAGGVVTGVIPHHLADKELAHLRAQTMHRVGSMHERKQLMADLSDGFLALPGGIGTLEEWFETLTWLQLDLHHKPVGLLNVRGFFDPILAQLELMARERFLKPAHRDLPLVDSDIPRLIDKLLAFKPSSTGKWLDREPGPELR